MANEANHNTLPWVQGNHLELALPMKIVYFTPNGKITQDYEPPTGSTICVEFQSNVNALCFTPTIEGNVLHVTDNGELPVGTYAVNIYVTEPSGDKRCSKLKNSIVVYDDNAETVEEFDDFPDWADGAIISNEIFYFTGTKEVEYITVDTFEQLPQEGVIGNIYRVANYDGTQVNPNAYAEYYWSGSQYKLLDTKNYGIDEKPENGSNNLVKSGGIKSSLDEKANKNGYYETLGAGTATNLRAADAHDDTFIYRKSGGSQEIATGTAFLEGIKGNTLAWNQLGYADISGEINGCNITYNSTKHEFNITGTSQATGTFYLLRGMDFTRGHKYLIHHPYTINSGSSTPYTENYIALIRIIGSTILDFVPNNSYYTIYTATDNFSNVSFGSPVSTNVTADFTWKNLMVFDLTLIYGKGNEPSTPEQFEADYLRWFGKPLTYESYDEGSLRSVKMSGIKTVGFNQWDEEWEQGAISVASGNYLSDSNRIRPKNFISVLPNTSYYIHVASKPTGQVYVIFYYDDDMTKVLSYKSITSTRTFTTPTNCRFIKFSFETTTQYGGTYNNDICINISDQSKNGTYEPYEGHNVLVPVTTLTGKVNGQGESVVIFPDGMKGVGNIKDEIKVENGITKAIKRIGRVDLGSLNGYYQSITTNYPNGFYRVVISGLLHKNYQDIKCGRYNYVSNGWTTDKVIRTGDVGSGSVYIIDSSITSKSAFETALSGVYLDYELAEPIEYVVDDFWLPINYEVNNGGTEEIVNVENTQFVSPTLTLRYSIDAARTIENLPVGYQSQESMANLLNALGAAMGGTWTTTFDTATNRYTYTFRSN